MAHPGCRADDDNGGGGGGGGDNRHISE